MLKISVHSLIKNEQRWIWYALMSVVDHVDEVLVWDTGSTDDTLKIVKSIKNPKIKLRELGEVDAQSHSALRQQMLDETNSDWILILDGDEVWWQTSIASVVKTINRKPNLAAIISPFYNAVGDVFHFQDPSQISYHIKSYQGPYTLRAINRKLPGLRIVNPHGRQEYQTKGRAIQDLEEDRLMFVNSPFFHLTHLLRSDSLTQDKMTLKRNWKYRYDLGKAFDENFAYPEVFYQPTPVGVPSPFIQRDWKYLVMATCALPLRALKRLFVAPNHVGY